MDLSSRASKKRETSWGGPSALAAMKVKKRGDEISGGGDYVPKGCTDVIRKPSSIYKESR
jgi:hypothetical protein